MNLPLLLCLCFFALGNVVARGWRAVSPSSSSTSTLCSWRATSKAASKAVRLCVSRSSSALKMSKSFGSKPNAEIFFCSECGTEHVKWMGRCVSCKEWNTVKAFRAARTVNSPLDIRSRSAPSSSSSSSASSASSSFSSSMGASAPSSSSSFGATSRVSSGNSGGRSVAPWLAQGSNGFNGSLVAMESVNIDFASQTFPLFSTEVNRVLGGGLVRGSVVLLAGEPGVGKSTLLLQLAASVVKDVQGGVVYISGEENAEQIVTRARRLELATRGVYLINDVDADFAIDNILAMSELPTLVIVDSIQTMRTAACSNSMGSVTQTRESAARFVQLAKATGCAVLLVGHVTKSGEVAGPRVLEHMVDTVLYLEGSERAEYRLLRGIKNRFGSTAEVGVLSMSEAGLADVANPSELFMSDGVFLKEQEGSAVAVIMEGTRPLLAEVQCLVSTTSPFAKANVKRMSDGFPVQRLVLICAVIEKRLKLALWNRDIYLNIAGGLRVSEPSSDLAVAMTVISSLSSVNIKAGTAFIGELGLGGEIRGGKGLAQRVSEAKKMGFTTIIVPKSAGLKAASKGGAGISAASGVYGCATLKEVLPLVLEGSQTIEDLLRDKKKKKKSSSASASSSSSSAESANNFRRPAFYDPEEKEEEDTIGGEEDTYLDDDLI